MSLKVLDIDGNKKEEVDLGFSDENFDQEKANHILYLLDNYQKNHDKVPCASTKTRSMVQGGGAKPYKQKGTGNARRGTNRSPLRRGGGVIFGPRPHTYKTDLNNKIIQKALRWLLVSKADQIVVLGLSEETTIKTKKISLLLDKLKRNKEDKIVFLTRTNEENVTKSFRNIRNSFIEDIMFPHVSRLIYAKYIFLTKETLKILVERLNNVK